MSILNASPVFVFDARILFGSGYPILWGPFQKVAEHAYRIFTGAQHIFHADTLNNLLPSDLETIPDVVAAAVRVACEQAIRDGKMKDPLQVLDKQQAFDWTQLFWNSTIDRLTAAGCDFLDHLTDFQEMRVGNKKIVPDFIFIVPYPFFAELLENVAPDLKFRPLGIPEKRFTETMKITFPHSSEVHVVSSDPQFLDGDKSHILNTRGHPIPCYLHTVSPPRKSDLRVSSETFLEIMGYVEQSVDNTADVLIPGGVLEAARAARAELLKLPFPPPSLQAPNAEHGPLSNSEFEEPEEDNHWPFPPTQYHVFLNISTGLEENVTRRMLQSTMRDCYDMVAATLYPNALRQELPIVGNKRHPADRLLKFLLTEGQPLPAAQLLIDSVEARLTVGKKRKAVSLGGHGREKLIEGVEALWWDSLQETGALCLGGEFKTFCDHLRELQQEILNSRSSVEFSIVAHTSAEAALANALMPMDPNRVIVVPIDGPKDRPVLPWANWPSTTFATISNSPNFGIELTRGKIATAFVVSSVATPSIEKTGVLCRVVGSADHVAEILYKTLGIKRVERPNNGVLVKMVRSRSVFRDGPDYI